MDGITSRSKVCVIATTSRLPALDPALRRFGRFDPEVEFGVPDEKGRLEVLKIHTKGMKLARDAALDVLAKRTAGSVDADLASLCTKAAMLCLSENPDLLDLEDERVDRAMLDGMRVGTRHFRQAIGTAKPSSRRGSLQSDDIGGLGEMKQELREMAESALLSSERFAKFGLEPSRSVLLYGPRGCGKTLLAKAVASECSGNFIWVRGPELLALSPAERASKVRTLFQKAR
jgi:transitional endoplasmic reticulum ATPase